MIIKKASPGLDQRNQLAEILGEAHQVVEYEDGVALADQVGDAHVLLVRDVAIDRDVIDAAPNLRLIQRPGDHLPVVDLDHAKRRGVFVSRFPSKVQGAPARDVAEHAFHLILSLAKESSRANENLRRGVVGLPKTRRVHGLTLGLVGVGNTGSELARLGRAFAMRVVAVKRTRDAALADELGLDWLETFDSLDRLLAESDIVSLHLPMIPDTVDFIGEAELAKMKAGAFLINISRAPMVNRAALLTALQCGHLGGAGLDVFWEEPVPANEPMLELPNVVITPHIAGDTRETERRLAELTADNVNRLARDEAPAWVVGVDVDAGER